MLRDNNPSFAAMSGEQLLQELKQAFYPLNYSLAAHGSLLELKQGTQSLSTFLLEFLRLQRELAPAAIAEETLCVILHRGVNEPYYSDLLRLNTTSFTVMFDYLQRLANTFSVPAAMKGPRPTDLTFDAMEIDHVRTRTTPASASLPLNPSATSAPVFPSVDHSLLTVAEIAAINAQASSQMICYYCRKPGHIQRDCKRRRLERRAAAEQAKKEEH